MQLEIECFYTSQFKLNDKLYIALDKSKPKDETTFYVHEIKAQSLLICDFPRDEKVKNLFYVALANSVSRN